MRDAAKYDLPADLWTSLQDQKNCPSTLPRRPTARRRPPR